MIVFEELTGADATVAAMSGVAEGDCSLRPEGREQRANFLRQLGADPARAVGVLQVHGNDVIEATEADAGRGGLDGATALGKADGIFTRALALPICMGIADCVPVLLYCDVPRAGAVLHSGRESTFLNIAASGVNALVETYGCRAEALRAVIGPSICEAHYEVSPEIAQRFRDAGYAVAGRNLNLKSIIQTQLIGCGLLPQSIFLTDQCTFDNPQYYSFRRDASPERNLAVLML